MSEQVAPRVGDDPRLSVVAATLEELWADLDLAPSIEGESAAVLEALDRHDTDEGVVRINLARQRAIERDRDRLRGALFAAVQAFAPNSAVRISDQTGATCLISFPVPESMVEGWRLIAEGGA